MQQAGADSRTLTLVRQEQSLGAVRDLDFGIELLGKARAGVIGSTLRLYRPAPTVAFGQRDTRLPGFGAAAYHEGTLIIDHVEPHSDAIAGAKGRFAFFGEMLAGALQSVGVHAAVGEIPGEYCPGEYSVHGFADEAPGRRVKLVGTAQRVVSGAWLFSSVVVVEDSAPIREVLTASYAALGLDWDPATAGAVNDLVPGLDVQAIEEAVVRTYAEYATLGQADFSSLRA